MARFGRQSMDRLEGVHPLLVDWAFRVVKVMDCKVVRGLGTLEEQRHFVETGASLTMDSYHLPQDDGMSHALDLAPYPIDWQDLNRFWLLGGVGMALAHEMDIPIIWGRDWDGDRIYTDQTFNDFPHWQIPRNL